MNCNEMNNIFQHVDVTKHEYQLMLDYTAYEKFQYITDLFDIHVKNNIDTDDTLGKFFNEIYDELNSTIELDSQEDSQTTIEYIPEDDINSKNRVDILIDDDHILIESNSLKSLKHIIYNFFDTGYVLQRDKETEKMFRKDKLTRYLRVYNIIGINSIICPN